MCDCKLVWMWGLRNQTKNVKLRESLEKLTCLLETNNATMKVTNSHREWNAALKIARKSGRFEMLWVSTVCPFNFLGHSASQIFVSGPFVL